MSRKWEGLKLFGLSHSLPSYKTEVRRGKIVVPCGLEEKALSEILFKKIFSKTKINVQSSPLE